jgi:D-alanyl-D-alanine carboxypeptidase (penicillin-binding protein 5/6)
VLCGNIPVSKTLGCLGYHHPEPMRRRSPAVLRTAILTFLVATVVVPAVVVIGAHRASDPTSVVVDASTLKHGEAAPRASWIGLSTVDDPRAFAPTSRPFAGPPVVQAQAGILVDIDTHQILWSANPHASLPMASTTKEMTALVVLENFSPDQVVTITPDALHQESDETRMGLTAGERLTVRELLYGMLLVSANDAATALAVDTVGMERFVAGMNAEAKALGLHDSHFATPVGLSAPGQYASPYDLAVIGATAYDRFPLFRQIVGTHDFDLTANATHKDYQLHNLNQLLDKYPAAVGIKPGWTGDAGACLVGMAVRGHHRLISVLLNADYPAATEAQLLDWGFGGEGLPPLLPPTPSPSPSPTPAP